VADLNTSVVAALEKAKTADPQKAKDIIPDRVHPDAGGHLLMAEALLKAWNAPATVSAVELDANDQHVVRAENTRVSNFASHSGHLTWLQADDALPMPIDWKDAVTTLAVRSSDFVEALDQQPLRVTGLSAANYSLKIDDEEVASFTREQLAQGVNLGELATPMAKQAAEVHELTLRHNDLHYARWREVQVPLQEQSFAHLKAAFEALDHLEDEVIAKQRATAQPRPHRFELIPQ